jgi:hypothetical protein
LPLYFQLSESDQEYIVDCIFDFFQQQKKFVTQVLKQNLANNV